MKAFTVAGIGKVIPRRGETRQRAEARARREHGRKSLGKSVFVPFVGKVKARKGERFRDAVKRRRKEITRKVVLFQGAESTVAFFDDRQLSQEVADRVREEGRATITLEGFVQQAPEFTRQRPWKATVVLDDPEDFDEGALFPILREEYRKRAPSNTVVTKITAS